MPGGLTVRGVVVIGAESPLFRPAERCDAIGVLLVGAQFEILAECRIELKVDVVRAEATEAPAHFATRTTPLSNLDDSESSSNAQSHA